MSKIRVPAHKVGKYLSRQQNYRRRINSVKQFKKMPFYIVSIEMFMVKHGKYIYGCRASRQQLSAVEPFTSIEM